MKIVIASDKFKGSLSSAAVNAIIASAARDLLPAARVIELPMADGGDGFAAAIRHYCGTETIRVLTRDPLGRKIQACYEWDQAKKTAIIEMAAASGLALLTPKERNPLATSSLGTGLLIRHAIKKGARKILLGVGGSATNDGGMGLVSALGFKIYDKEGKLLEGNGQSLQLVARIHPPKNLPAVQFVVAADVNNPLCGNNGASYVYGPQKGANQRMVAQLDKGLAHWADSLAGLTGKDVRNMAGAGAAGGVAVPLLSFFTTSIRPGTAIICQAARLPVHLRKADLLITGEGRIDMQSGQGKLVGRLVELAKKAGVPVLLVCGQRAPVHTLPNLLHELPMAVLASGSISSKTAMARPAELLYSRVLQSLRSLLT